VGSQREKGVRGEVAAEVDNAKQELTRAGAADCNAYRNRANRRNDVRSGNFPRLNANHTIRMKGILMTAVVSADSAKSSVSIQPLCHEELRKIDAYWRAANYLSVGQIYLYANPLLREPLCLHHVKPRLLGHWGTDTEAEFHLCTFESGHQKVRPECDLRMRTRTGRTGNGREYVSGRHLH
jgi:hypothetical protein